MNIRGAPASALGRVRGTLTWVLGMQGLESDRVRLIALRTLSLMAAAAGLLVLCRNGQSALLVGAAFTLYIALATLWVRGQYVASMTRDGIWTPPWGTSAVVVLVAGGLFWWGIAGDHGALFIGGLVTAFFGLGYLAMRLRRAPADREDQERRSFRRSVLLWTVVLAVMSALVLRLLSRLEHLSTPDLVLLGLLAASLPISVSVLTSRLITWLTDPVRDGRVWSRWVVAATVGGTLLVLLGMSAALARIPDQWAIPIVVVLVLLVFALVSSTYADIAVIIALIAALGLTQQQQAANPDAYPEGKQRVLLALGDSYMSGEGAKVFHAGTDDPSNHCRRAPTAWAEVAARPPEFDGFLSLACSGARTYNVVREQIEGGGRKRSQYPDSIGTQLDDYATEYADDFTPKLVVVSLGGNDAGFSTIGAMCLAPGNCGGEDDADDDATAGGGRGLLMPNLRVVDRQLRATFDQVSAMFDGSQEGPETPVAVVGYPDPIYRPAFGSDDPAADCSGVPLSPGDREFVRDFLVKLNDIVEAAAVDAGFYYIREFETSLAAAHLQLCDPRNDHQPGLNILSLQSVPGDANDRFNPRHWYHNSLHPNERGHVALAAAFGSWLADHPSLTANLAAHPRGRAVALAETDPVLQEPIAETACDLYEATDAKPTCESAGFRWVSAQVSHALLEGPGLPWGLVYLLVALGAWLLAVTVFSWRMIAARRTWHEPA